MNGLARISTGVAIVLIALVAWAAPAFAHVTVHPASVAAGSTDVELTFRVPNERDKASTTEVQVFFPTATPLLGVEVLPVPGWRDATATVKLSPPVRTDDGPVASAVSEVSWTATAGGITPGHYQDFDVEVGAMPGQPGDIVFKALQTYSSGEVVRWIQLSTPGEPPPDTPAPVLVLTPPGTATAGSTSPAAAGGGSGSGTATVIAVVALVLAIGALISAIMAIQRARGSTDRPNRPSRRPPP
jgi:uncharacterized protein YcnI